MGPRDVSSWSPHSARAARISRATNRGSVKTIDRWPISSSSSPFWASRMLRTAGSLSAASWSALGSGSSSFDAPDNADATRGPPTTTPATPRAPADPVTRNDRRVTGSMAPPWHGGVLSEPHSGPPCEADDGRCRSAQPVDAIGGGVGLQPHLGQPVLQGTAGDRRPGPGGGIDVGGRHRRRVDGEHRGQGPVGGGDAAGGGRPQPRPPPTPRAAGG